MYFSCLDLKRDLSGELNRNQIKPQHLCLEKSLGKIMQCLNPALLVAGFVTVRLTYLNIFFSKKAPTVKYIIPVMKYKNFKVRKIILLLFFFFLCMCVSVSGVKAMS